MIRLRQASRRYGARRALDEVTLEVPTGEVHALVGPNGAGKTTALRVLATLETLTGGAAAVAGHDPADDPGAVRAAIGYLGHETPVHDALTPREHLAFDARARGRYPHEVGLEALLEALDLAPDAPASRLSRGNRRRLGLARALVGDPPVLLLDEPFASLDARAAAAAADLVADLGTTRTVLLASHDLEQAVGAADRVHVLRDGRLAGSADAGDPDQACHEARTLLEEGP